MNIAQDPARLRVLPEPDHPLLRISPRISPHVQELEDQILAWADTFGLLDDERSRTKLARTRLGELIGRSYPRIGRSRLKAVAGWFVWAFVIDDCYDNPVGGYDESAARMLRVLTTDGSVVSTENQLDALLAEVWHGLAVDRSPHWRSRFSQHMAHFLAAFKYESINREGGHTPDLLGYTQLRRASGGITPSLDLLEVAVGLEVPPLLHETEQLRMMFNRAADVVVWVNDIVSLRKELIAGETSNGVLVLANERGLEIQDAVTAVYALVAEQLEQFDQAQGELDQLVSRWRGLAREELASLEVFVDGLQSWMRGNLDWSLGSDRYQVADGVRLTTDPSLVGP